MLSVNNRIHFLDCDRNPLGEQGALAIARSLKTLPRQQGFEVSGLDLWKFWRDLDLPELAYEQEWSNDEVLAVFCSKSIETDLDHRLEVRPCAGGFSRGCATDRNRGKLKGGEEVLAASDGNSSEEEISGKDTRVAAKAAGGHSFGCATDRNHMELEGEKELLAASDCSSSEEEVSGKDTRVAAKTTTRVQVEVESRRQCHKLGSKQTGSEDKIWRQEKAKQLSSVASAPEEGRVIESKRDLPRSISAEHGAQACGRCVCCHEYQIKLRALADEVKKHPLWALAEEVQRLEQEVQKGKMMADETIKKCERLRRIDAERIASLEVRGTAEKESFERLRSLDAEKIAALHKENLELHQARLSSSEKVSQQIQILQEALRRQQDAGKNHACQDSAAQLASQIDIEIQHFLLQVDSHVSKLETDTAQLRSVTRDTEDKVHQREMGQSCLLTWAKEREELMANLKEEETQVRKLKRRLKELMEETGKLQRAYDTEKATLAAKLKERGKALCAQRSEMEDEKLRLIEAMEEKARHLKLKHEEELFKWKTKLKSEDDLQQRAAGEYQQETQALRDCIGEQKLRGCIDEEKRVEPSKMLVLAKDDNAHEFQADQVQRAARK